MRDGHENVALTAPICQPAQPQPAGAVCGGPWHSLRVRPL